MRALSGTDEWSDVIVSLHVFLALWFHFPTGKGSAHDKATACNEPPTGINLSPVSHSCLHDLRTRKPVGFLQERIGRGAGRCRNPLGSPHVVSAGTVRARHPDTRATDEEIPS